MKNKKNDLLFDALA